MKNRYFFIVFLFLSLLLIATIFKGKIFSMTQNNIDSIEHNQSRFENNLLKEGFFHSYDFETININFDEFIIDANGNPYTLNDLSSNAATVVLFVHPESCNKCVSANIKRISEFQSSGLNTVIIIGGLKNRDFKAYVASYGISDIAYSMPDGYFEGFRFSPIVYCVANNSEACCFYAPSEMLPELTNNYYEKINLIFKTK